MKNLIKNILHEIDYFQCNIESTEMSSEEKINELNVILEKLRNLNK